MWHHDLWQHSLGDLHVAQSDVAGRRRLIFLHGVLRNWETFLPLLAPLASRYALTAIDARGHGGSAKPEGGYLVRDYVSHTAAWLQSNADDPVVLYGHSLGAMVALAVASAVPQHVAGCILEDPPFHTMGDRIAQTPYQAYFREVQQLMGSHRSATALAAALAEVPWTDPHTGRTTRLGDLRDGVALRFFAHSLCQTTPAVLDSVIAGLWLDGYDLAAIAASVACPVLVLQGDEAAGGTLVEEDLTLLRSHLADHAIVRFPGVGHSIHTARTQEVANLVFAFVESLGPDVHSLDEP